MLLSVLQTRKVELSSGELQFWRMVGWDRNHCC